LTTTKSYLHAQRLVTSCYIDLERDNPGDFKKYFKHSSREAKEHGFRTKVEMAMDLVDES
jgi:hypothetical protein